MFACRVCRVPLSAQEGCTVCNPMRRNLVAVGEQEDDAPSLANTSNEAVTAVRRQIAHHREILKTNPGNGKSEKGLLACANTLAKIVGETRKLVDDGYKAVEAMSFTERASMFVDWYAALPPAYRTTLREQMADHEVRIAAPVPAATTEPS